MPVETSTADRTCQGCDVWVVPQPDKPYIGMCRRWEGPLFQRLVLFNDGCDQFKPRLQLVEVQESDDQK